MAERARPLARILEAWRPLALGLAGVIAANLVVHVGYVRELVRVSGDREAILTARRSEISEQAQGVQAIESTVSKFACAESDTRHVFEDVLSSKLGRMTSIQRELREMAREGRLDPTRIAYTLTEVGDTGLVRFGLAFPVEGTYEQVKELVRKVEASENFLVIDDLSMTGDRTQGTGLKLQVRLATYFLSPDISVLRAAFPGLAGAS